MRGNIFEVPLVRFELLITGRDCDTDNEFFELDMGKGRFLDSAARVGDGAGAGERSLERRGVPKGSAAGEPDAVWTELAGSLPTRRRFESDGENDIGFSGDSRITSRSGVEREGPNAGE